MNVKRILGAVVALFCMVSVRAQDGKNLELPMPDKNRSTASVMYALGNRKSIRECAPRPLTMQDLADVLWAANGINRADGRRTAPSSLNVQDIEVYAFTAGGVYRYRPATYSLQLVVEGDHRRLLAGPPSPARKQDYVVKFPLILLYVSELSRIGGDDAQVRLTAAMDAAFVSENVNLFCAGAGLCTVTRASMDRKAVAQLLKLTDRQLPVLNNAVGYPQ